MPLPSGPEMRKSCDACSQAKVRCSKSKPTCQRCEDRGISCQYLITKKTGRKPLRRDTQGKTFRNERLSTQSNDSSRSNGFFSPELLRSMHETSSLYFPSASRTSSYSEPPIERRGSMAWNRSVQSVSTLTSPELSDSLLDGGNEVLFEDFFLTNNTSSSEEHFDSTGVILSWPLECGLLNHPQDFDSTSSSTHAVTQILHTLSRNDVNTQESVLPHAELDRATTLSREALSTLRDTIESSTDQDSQGLVLACLVLHRVVDLYLSPLHASSTANHTNIALFRQVLNEIFRVHSLATAIGDKLPGSQNGHQGFGGGTFQPSYQSVNMPVSSQTLHVVHHELQNRLSSVSNWLLEILRRSLV